MNIEHFNESLFLAARFADNQGYDDAITVLRPLVECVIPDFNKCIVCINMAILYGHKGDSAEALRWYDRGIEFERPLGRFFAAEQKAAYLAENGWTSESLMLYERLLAEPSLNDEDGERIRHNLSVLRERLG